MILIADSGSTKTDWCVVEKGKLIQQVSTKGTNPFFQSEEEISNEIATALLPQLTTNAFDAVYFYGAGCGFPRQNCHGTPCHYPASPGFGRRSGSKYGHACRRPRTFADTNRA